MLTSSSRVPGGADIIFAVHAGIHGLQRVEVDDHKTAPGVVGLGSVRIHYWGSADIIDDVRVAAEKAMSVGVALEVAQYDPLPPHEQWALMIDGEAVYYTSWDLSRIGLLSHLGEATMMPSEYRAIEIVPGEATMMCGVASITGKHGTTAPIVHRWISKPVAE